MKYAYLVILLILLQSCAPQVKRIVATDSGSPEIIISNFTVKETHDLIVNVFLSGGARLESDNEVNIIFSKEMEEGRAAGNRFRDSLVSGEKGNLYRDEISFFLLKTLNGVKVIARLSIVKQLKNGQISRYEETDNEENNEFQNVLYELKKTAESKK